MTWALPPLSAEMTHCWKEPTAWREPAAAGSGETPGPVAEGAAGAGITIAAGR